jgi:hypothetical protein
VNKLVRIQEKEGNTLFYLKVEPHYKVPTDGKGKVDAVLFEMGQHGLNGHEIDAGITCHVQDAKAFAQSILQVCEEIEGGE